MKVLLYFLIAALLVGAAFAQEEEEETTVPQGSGMDNVRFAISELCIQVKSLIPVVIFLMIVAGGVVYAAGQVFGAEVRSRANVWATAMVIGSIICVLIVTILPTFLATMYGDPNVNFECG